MLSLIIYIMLAIALVPLIVVSALFLLKVGVVIAFFAVVIFLCSLVRITK